MQLLRNRQIKQIITVDTLPLRCQFSQQLGADEVINASEIDPVEVIKQLTNGRGVDLVIDCVGGYAGIKSFEQTQDMVADRGTIQLIAQQQPLPLHAWQQIPCPGFIEIIKVFLNQKFEIDACTCAFTIVLRGLCAV